MSTIIHIETATEVCSSALSSNGKVLIYKENRKEQSHATSLGVFVEEIMQFVREKDLKVDAVSVSSGPGSYTGLRIGASEAKGLSYGLNIPLIAIPTHKIMAWMIKDKVDPDSLLCPMIDARRMEVYTTFFDTNLNILRATSADIVDNNSYIDLLENHKIVFFGNGAEKCKEVVTHPNALFLSNIQPFAFAMIALAEHTLSVGDFVDSAYFEPFYLKEFVATIPKNKVF
ncbi:MAG: tRNA (adenosine(37)-N6)-threonylcarbamoyltransferase complex dimerization subunit type 1 TsaB [Bacteroidia bacterium]|nr:tRNA (adenosine(37)-N6)-threonylcarbamoyltransferase complex dimerization subunit type 1 TsaB [Bacteroidia bacterium]